MRNYTSHPFKASCTLVILAGLGESRINSRASSQAHCQSFPGMARLLEHAMVCSDKRTQEVDHRPISSFQSCLALLALLISPVGILFIWGFFNFFFLLFCFAVLYPTIAIRIMFIYG